jgi:hypothetical protein
MSTNQLTITLDGETLKDQQWFANFDWQNFNYSDAVFTEDNGEIPHLAVRFTGVNDGTVNLRTMSKAWQRRAYSNPWSK